MKIKRVIIKTVSIILAVAIIFVGGYFIASDFGKNPFFYISRYTVSSMETSNYASDGTAMLTERESAIIIASLTGVRLKRIQGTDEKDLIGAQDPSVLTVSPFGKVRIVFIHVIKSYYDTSQNYDCISINGKVYKSNEDYEYMFDVLSTYLGQIRSSGHAEELSINTNATSSNSY